MGLKELHEYWHQGEIMLRAASEATTARIIQVATTVRSGLAESVEGFLQQHPEHRVSLGGRDPVCALALLAALASLAAWEAFAHALALVRFFQAFLRTLASLCCAPCRCCCGSRCCGRRIAEAADVGEAAMATVAGRTRSR